MKRFEFCMGVECPVRNQCGRYTEYNKAPIIRKCTAQKKFIKKD